MHTFSIGDVHFGRFLTAAAPLALAAALLLPPASASAANGSQYGSIGQYGQAERFGAFDTAGYDNEQYNGTLTGGDFLNPVGFAVDTDDTSAPGDTAIYVLDRVSDWGIAQAGTPTEWRLQKLSDTGSVLGTTLFELPNSGVSALGVNSPTGVLGLAVDDSNQTIYAVLYKTTGSGNGATPYADEILGWSTTVSGGKIGGYSAAGLTKDTVSVEVSGYEAPGVLSAAGSGQIGTLSLYDPQGLAVQGTAVEVEGDRNLRSATGAPQGPASVDQISTSGGTETANWSSNSLTGADASAVAAGISTNPGGSSLEVLLNPTIGSSVTDAVDLAAGLTAPTVLVDGALDPTNADAAPLVLADTSGNRPSAGPQVVELSNGLYASDFFENTGGGGYWEKGVNEGVRLIAPNTLGELASPFAPPTTIFDTLGNATAGGACYIGNGGAGGASNGVALAAGANGTLWVLTTGQDSSAYPGSGSSSAYTSDRQLIEFAPAATSVCAGPSGTFTVANGSGSPQAASSPLTVSAGSTVDFNASTISYPAGATNPASVFAYEWNPTGSGSTPTVSDTLAAQGDFEPPATATYKYTTPGTYTPTLNVLGDFGDYLETGSVIVQSASKPTAAFTTASTAVAGQPVGFNASASAAASGASIVDYDWSFGDGSEDETQGSSDSHTYAAAGTYTVTLTVRDNDEQVSAPVSQSITITSATGATTTGNTTGNTTGAGTTTGTTTGAATGTTTGATTGAATGATTTGAATGTGTTTGATTGTTAGTTTGATTATADRSATKVSPTAVEKDGEVVVTLTCPSTKVSCGGTIAVKTASPVATTTKKKAKKKVLVLGRKSFSLTGGQRSTLTIKLSSAGRKLLKSLRHLKTKILVNAHDSYGDPGSQTISLALTEPGKKKGKK